MEKIITASELKKLSLKVMTRSSVEFVTSESAGIKVVYSYDKENVIAEHSNQDGVLKLSLKDPEADIKNKEVFNKLFSKGLMNIFMNFNQTIEEFKEITPDTHEIKVKVYLPQSVSSVKVEMNSGELLFDSVLLNKLKLKLNSVKVNFINSSESENAELNLNSCKLKMILNNYSKNIIINGNSTKITLYRDKNFFGNIFCKSNSSKISGDLSGDSNFGKVECKLNSSKLNIIKLETEAA